MHEPRLRRIRFIKVVLTVAIGLLILSLSEVNSQPQAVGLERKLIEYGWDTPRLEYIRDHIAEMERRPFDGLIFRLTDGGGWVFQTEKWNPDLLARQLPILQSIKWKTFDSNFLAVFAASSMDWYSDQDWRAVTQHVAFMARAARVTRTKGIMFDPEPYGANPWKYALQPHASDRSFAEYKVVVRRRGREFMRAMQHEYRGLELLTFYNYSYFVSVTTKADSRVRDEALRQDTWGLLPSFLDGILDEADSHVHIIDGHEHSYLYQTAEDFSRAAAEVKRTALMYVSPELKNKYVRQYQVAQPVFIDWIFNLFASPLHSVPARLTDGERVQLAEHNTYYAMKNVDRYVWVYSQHMNWWTGEHVPAGAEEALRSAKRKFAAGDDLGFDMAAAVGRAEAR